MPEGFLFIFVICDFPSNIQGYMNTLGQEMLLSKNLSIHVFSMITLDHNHKQLNALIKGQVGAVGLTEDPVALRHWMVFWS